MADIQIRIDEVLNTLNTLLGRVCLMRQQFEALEKDLSEVRRDYNQKLGILNDEAFSLETRRNSLRTRISGRSEPQFPKLPMHQELPKPPKNILEPSPLPNYLPPKDPRADRKRALADHIEYFVSSENRENVMQVVNAVLEDEKRDLGDMLELITWGDIWTARSVWETLDEQYKRLQNWALALEERLTYWDGQIRGLENDSLYDLMQEMKSRSHSDWIAYLDILARRQAEKNKNLKNEIAFLEQQLSEETE